MKKKKPNSKEIVISQEAINKLLKEFPYETMEALEKLVTNPKNHVKIK